VPQLLAAFGEFSSLFERPRNGLETRATRISVAERAAGVKSRDDESVIARSIVVRISRGKLLCAQEMIPSLRLESVPL
jgi:hypothetical protein